MSAEQAIYGFDEFTNRIGYGRNITQRGGEIDDELGYPTVLLIRWAAGKNYSKVLSTQLKKNKDIFLSFMESASLDISNKLMEAIIEPPIPNISPIPVPKVHTGATMLMAARASLPKPCPTKIPSVIMSSTENIIPATVGKNNLLKSFPIGSLP